MKKKLMTIGIIAALAASASACTQTEQRTAGYGVGGAALGALAGGALSGGRGALTGAALGGAAGTVIGTATTRNQSRVVYGDYDDSGRRIVQHRRVLVRPAGAVATMKVTQTTTPTVRYCEQKDAYGETYRAPC